MVSCLYRHESVQPFLVLQQLLLSAASVDFLKPPKLLSSSLLPLLHTHTATRHLTREGKLHAVNLTLIKLRAAPLFQFYEKHSKAKMESILRSPGCALTLSVLHCQYSHQPQEKKIVNLKI